MHFSGSFLKYLVQPVTSRSIIPSADSSPSTSRAAAPSIVCTFILCPYGLDFEFQKLLRRLLFSPFYSLNFSRSFLARSSRLTRTSHFLHESPSHVQPKRGRRDARDLLSFFHYHTFDRRWPTRHLCQKSARIARKLCNPVMLTSLILRQVSWCCSTRTFPFQPHARTHPPNLACSRPSVHKPDGLITLSNAKKELLQQHFYARLDATP